LDIRILSAMRTILDKKKLLESLKETLDAEKYLPPQQADLLFNYFSVSFFMAFCD
jgi:hypothetical protein